MLQEIFLAKRDDVREIWLDTRDISVHSLSSEGHPLRYELETEHKVCEHGWLILQDLYYVLRRPISSELKTPFYSH